MKKPRLMTAMLFGSVLMGVSALASAGPVDMVSADVCKGWMGGSFFLMNRGESGYSAFLQQCAERFSAVTAEGECAGACMGLYQDTFNVDEQAFRQAFSGGCVKQCTDAAVKHATQGQPTPVALQ